MPRVRGMHGERLDDAIGRVESLVVRVLRRIAQTLAGLVGGSPSPRSVSEDDLQVIRRDWATAVTVELVPALAEAYAESAQVLAAEFTNAGRPVEPVSLNAPETADFLDAATNRLVGVADTLWEIARKELADGIRAGEDIEELAARLQEAGGFGEARARTIARTEVAAAANSASLAQALRLGDSSMRKEWLATTDGPVCDERTRAAHCAAHEQVQPVSEPFEVGGEWLMYPGQPIGSPGNTIDCRCSQGYVWEDDVVDEPLTAAAEVHTGAMIALRPSEGDAERLAIDGGEPGDQLHTTLMYLGEAADIPPEVQQAVIAGLRALIEDAIRPDYDLPMVAEGFAIDLFNPPGTDRDDGKDRDTCVVLGLSGGDLGVVHGMVGDAVREVLDEAGLQAPDQHSPWIPHVTLTYTDDLSMVEKLADRVGPVTFDAIRVEFAGEVTDIPLTPVPEAETAPPVMQMATVMACDGDRLTLAVGGETVSGVRYLSGYEPHVTDVVALASVADELAVIGRAVNDSAAVDGAVAELADSAPTADLAAQPGEHFHTRVLEGVSTGMREFAPDAITWREPPFAYHWQWKSAAHGGLPETVQVGLITRAERADPVVHFWGRLDLRSPEGLDYARRLVEGWTRWSSVGADESIKDRDIDVEYVLAVEPDAPAEDPEIDLMTFNQYRVAEITAVSVPALADATVEPTPELIAILTEMGVLPPTAPVTSDSEDGDFAAVRSHDTATADGEWDAAANEGRLPSPLPVATARAEYAWIDDTQIEGDHIPQGAGKLPHHEVSAEGEPGAANVAGVRNALARLPQSDIPDTDREAVHAHLAAHLVDAGGDPSEFTTAGADMPEHTNTPGDATVIVAAGHTITIPDVPPAEWFTEPSDVTARGALTITDEGRLFGYLAPSGVAHRSFRNRRVEVPMGNVDYGRWMGGEAIVAGGNRVVAGPITMNCGHMPPAASADPGARMEHYDNTCSVVAQAAIGENRQGVWIAGALLPGVSAEQVARMLACRLSGDWAPHPERNGWREFVAALLVPVPGFPMARTAPSTLKIADGALVAAAVPVQLAAEDVEEPMEMEVAEVAPGYVEGDRVRVLDPRDPDVTEGEIVAVHEGPAYALKVAGRDEPYRWLVAEELEPADTAPDEEVSEPEVVEVVMASAEPDLGPALEFVARKVGRDPASRMAALRDRVHSH